MTQTTTGDRADLDRKAAVEKLAGILTEASAAAKATQQARQDALEEIADGYRALCAVTDLVFLGAGRSDMGYRHTLDSIDAENMGFLLNLVARKIGKPLEETQFAELLTCQPQGGME